MNWYKKTYVCNHCDALIEISTRSNVIRDRNCFECTGSLTLLSVEDVTIKETTEKEPPMNTDTHYMTREFLESQLVENKTTIEQLQNELTEKSKAITTIRIEQGNFRNSVKEYLIDNYDELELHADAIAEILDIELTRSVTYEVTMTATVSIDVPMGEDAESILEENLYIESNHGNISVDDYSVYNMSEF